MEFIATIQTRKGGAFIICPEGRLDAASAPVFEEQINPLLVPETKAVVLNLEKLSYLSSAGIRVIFKLRKAISASGGSFAMTNLQPQIRKVFAIINALPDTPVFSSIEEADDYLDALQKKEMEGQSPSQGL